MAESNLARLAAAAACWPVLMFVMPIIMYARAVLAVGAWLGLPFCRAGAAAAADAAAAAHSAQQRQQRARTASVKQQSHRQPLHAPYEDDALMRMEPPPPPQGLTRPPSGARLRRPHSGGGAATPAQLGRYTPAVMSEGPPSPLRRGWGAQESPTRRGHGYGCCSASCADGRHVALPVCAPGSPHRHSHHSHHFGAAAFDDAPPHCQDCCDGWEDPGGSGACPCPACSAAAPALAPPPVVTLSPPRTPCFGNRGAAPLRASVRSSWGGSSTSGGGSAGAPPHAHRPSYSGGGAAAVPGFGGSCSGRQSAGSGTCDSPRHGALAWAMRSGAAARDGAGRRGGASASFDFEGGRPSDALREAQAALRLAADALEAEHLRRSAASPAITAAAAMAGPLSAADGYAAALLRQQRQQQEAAAGAAARSADLASRLGALEAAWQGLLQLEADAGPAAAQGTPTVSELQAALAAAAAKLAEARSRGTDSPRTSAAARSAAGAAPFGARSDKAAAAARAEEPPPLPSESPRQRRRHGAARQQRAEAAAAAARQEQVPGKAGAGAAREQAAVGQGQLEQWGLDEFTAAAEAAAEQWRKQQVAAAAAAVADAGASRTPRGHGRAPLRSPFAAYAAQAPVVSSSPAPAPSTSPLPAVSPLSSDYEGGAAGRAWRASDSAGQTGGDEDVVLLENPLALCSEAPTPEPRSARSAVPEAAVPPTAAAAAAVGGAETGRIGGGDSAAVAAGVSFQLRSSEGLPRLKPRVVAVAAGVEPAAAAAGRSALLLPFLAEELKWWPPSPLARVDGEGDSPPRGRAPGDDSPDPSEVL